MKMEHSCTKCTFPPTLPERQPIRFMYSEVVQSHLSLYVQAVQINNLRYLIFMFATFAFKAFRGNCDTVHSSHFCSFDDEVMQRRRKFTITLSWLSHAIITGTVGFEERSSRKAQST